MTQIGWIIVIVLGGSFIAAVLVGWYLNLRKELEDMERIWERGEDRPP